MSTETIQTGLTERVTSRQKKNKQIVKEKYVKKYSANLTDDEAKIFGKALEKLRRADGKIYTEDILICAKDKNHILHNYRGFDWDTKSAAHKFNKMKASELLNSIALEITYKEVKSKKISINVVPAFVNSKRYNEPIWQRGKQGESGSRKMTDVLEDSDERNKLMLDFGLKLKSVKSNYDYLFEYYPKMKKEFKMIQEIADHIIDKYSPLSKENKKVKSTSKPDKIH